MPGVRIDLRKLEDLIRRKGVWVDWVRTSRCPCLTDSGRTKFQCPVCASTGWMKLDTQRVRGLLVSQNRKGQLNEGGELGTGSAQFTPPRWVRLAEGDWIVSAQYPQRTSEVVEHQPSPHWTGDPLNTMFPVELVALRGIRDGAAHLFDPTGYTLDTDKGVITWADAATDRPKAGEKYAVELMHREAYQIWRGDKPMHRGAEDKRLHDRAALRILTRRVLREPV
jgi:hypothetical protein